MSHSHRRPKAKLFLSLLVGMSLFGQAGKTLASNFSVNPIQIFLAPKASKDASSKLLALKNDSSEILRFQVTAFAWKQSDQGAIQLSPTKDVIFFPTLLSLAPGEKRNVRLGIMVPASEQEKTYRLIVEELPSPATLQQSSTATQIRVLTKMSVPIFIQPIKPVLDGSIQAIATQKGHLSFRVKNTGNVHFLAQQVRVKGFGASAQSVFDRSTTGWYILANSDRAFEMELPKTDCAKIQSLTVEVQTAEKKSFTQSLKTPGGVCR